MPCSPAAPAGSPSTASPPTSRPHWSSPAPAPPGPADQPPRNFLSPIFAGSPAVLPLTLLSIPPTRPPASGCVPGRDGVPDSPLGHLMCGDYLLNTPHTIWLFTRAHWPLLLIAAV